MNAIISDKLLLRVVCDARHRCLLVCTMMVLIGSHADITQCFQSKLWSRVTVYQWETAARRSTALLHTWYLQRSSLDGMPMMQRQQTGAPHTLMVQHRC